MKAFLIQLFLSILTKLPSWLRPKLIKGAGPGELEKRLKAKAKKDGWNMKSIIILFILAEAISGCAFKTVYVPDGKAVRLRQAVKAKVWVMTDNNEEEAGKMRIPEGWYCLPDTE